MIYLSIASEITRINTNIANAYEACETKGALMPAVASRKSVYLYDTVLSIPSRAEASKKAINIYDYDGTRLLSVDTPAELAGIDQSDIAPYHKGLRFGGFNHTVDEISACYRKYGRCDIGVIYTTEDGNGGHPTRLYLSLPNNVNLSPTLFLQISDGSLTIDWGDDTTPDTISEAGSSYVNITQGHTYAAAGDYVISLLFSGEGGYILGQGTTATTVLGDYSSIYTNFLLKAEIGADCALSASAFRQYFSLRYVILTKGITALPNRVFAGCCSLRCLILPNVVDSIETAALQMTYSLSALSLPPSLTDIQNIGLSSIYSLTDVIIPIGLKTIGSSALTTCKGLTYVALPQSVTSVGASAFSDCANLKILDLTDFTDPAAVPTLANTNAFSGTALTEIWVSSAEMKAAFSAATNWSSFSNRFTIK